jgi:DNA-binding NarL/FixJ family response regulator
MINLFIIDDHPLVTDGIRTMLSTTGYIHISGSAKTAKQALDDLNNVNAEVILLDISLPDMDGLELCKHLRKKLPQAKIIGLTSANEAGIITQLLHNGANGYLLKNMEQNELMEAIDKVMDGGIYLSKDANEKLLQQFTNVQTAVKSVPVLTRREKEILVLLNEGLKGPQIAEKLFLSTHTIETHRKNLLQKFNVHTTQMLLKVADNYRLL